MPAAHATETGELSSGFDPDYDIIAINDGEQGRYGAILDELARQHPRRRVIHLASNQGKAMALRMGALLSRNEYLVCIDGDAILERDACTWMMWHFLSSPKVGAVTGNPRIRNRSSLLGKIQVGEFSCIVGTIKRAQRIYGRLFSISGVICGIPQGCAPSGRILESSSSTQRKSYRHWWQPNHGPRAPDGGRNPPRSCTLLTDLTRFGGILIPLATVEASGKVF